MKIIAPVSCPQETEALIDAGADELYCGVITEKWTKRFSSAISPNMRSLGHGSLHSFGELRELAAIAHSRGVPVFLTLNSKYYTEEQYPFLCEQIKESEKSGIDAFIVSDAGLLFFLKKERIAVPVHLSTVGATLNSWAVAFYKDLGVSRIILPADLAIKEIRGLVQNNPDVSFEVFVLNNSCRNITGFCTFQHTVNSLLNPFAWKIYGNGRLAQLALNIKRKLRAKPRNRNSVCSLDFDISMENELSGAKKEKKLIDFVSSSLNHYSLIDACGACRIAEFEKMGIYGIKIAGRNHSVSKKTQDVKFIKRVSADGSRMHAKEIYKMAYKRDCGNFCYYPEGE